MTDVLVDDQGLGGAAQESTETASLGPSSERKSRIPLVAAAVVLLALLLAAGWWVNFTRSPGYSLGMLAKAVQNKDWDGVQKYMDVEAVIGQMVDAVMGKSLEQDDSGLGALAAGLAQSMKPGLVQQAKEGFKKSVEQGQDSGKGDEGALGGYFAAKKVKSITRIGDEALVTVEVPQDGGKPFDLKLKMKRVDNFWRVVAIENVLDLPTLEQ